jgi:lysophospholipase L1-like esterase
VEQGGQADDAGSDAGSGGGSDAGAGPAVEYHPDDGVLQVWTLGDSITVGVDGGFRNDLYNLLSDDGLDVDMVGTQYDESTEIADKDHEGHVAFTIENTIDDVDSWLAQITPPDVVVLWLGCNDFAWWTNILPADHADQFDKLVNHLLDVLPAESVIVIGTIPPQSSELIESVELDRNQMADDFDDILRVRVPKYTGYGKRVFFADVRAIVSLDDLYDGIHPTRETHARIGKLFYDVMHDNLGL